MILLALLIFLAIATVVFLHEDNPCMFGHDWDMYAGYDRSRPHQRAMCLKCHKKYK